MAAKDSMQPDWKLDAADAGDKTAVIFFKKGAHPGDKKEL
jgi:hypothetical protein